MSERLKIDLPVIVEGRYDKSTLASVIDARIITLGGFAVFNSREKQALLRKIAVNGVILLTDSDGGGKLLRSFVKGILPKDKVYNLHIPKIEGKESRKASPSKEGLLGVEGMPSDLLRSMFLPFAGQERAELSAKSEGRAITKLDFYNHGLSGGCHSRANRTKLAEYFGLPTDMSTNALLDALNIISDAEEFTSVACEIFNG